jgi:hypothetical protein
MRQFCFLKTTTRRAIFICLITSVAAAQTVIEMLLVPGGSLRSIGCNDAVFTDGGGLSDGYSFVENGGDNFCPLIETDRMVPGLYFGSRKW